MGGGLFDLLSPTARALFLLGASGRVPGLRARPLVDGALGLAGSTAACCTSCFNLMWVRDLAPAVARLYGAGRMVIIWTSRASIGGFLAQLDGRSAAPVLPSSWAAPELTVGASASIFGLLGALICYGSGRGSAPCAKWSGAGSLAGVLFGLVCPGIDNWAHAGGLRRRLARRAAARSAA